MEDPEERYGRTHPTQRTRTRERAPRPPRAFARRSQSSTSTPARRSRTHHEWPQAGAPVPRGNEVARLRTRRTSRETGRGADGTEGRPRAPQRLEVGRRTRTPTDARSPECTIERERTLRAYRIDQDLHPRTMTFDASCRADAQTGADERRRRPVTNARALDQVEERARARQGGPRAGGVGRGAGRGPGHPTASPSQRRTRWAADARPPQRPSVERGVVAIRAPRTSSVGRDRRAACLSKNQNACVAGMAKPSPGRGGKEGEARKHGEASEQEGCETPPGEAGPTQKNP